MIEKITVGKKNESQLLVDADSGILMELNEYFSFFVDGYKYMPLYRNKVWDGKIRIFNALAQELPVGLLHQLKEFTKKRGYELEYEDGEYGSPEQYNAVDPEEIMKFITSLNLRGNGNPITVRDYQFDAICTAITNKRSILLSPTGSGKSLIIYVLLRWLLERCDDRKILIIVPTTSLVEQMYADFADYSSHDSWNAIQECHKIFSGKAKDMEENVVISTWQSVYKLPPAWFQQFYGVFGDECHGFKSKSLTSIMNKCVNTAYRYGTTGTLDGTQTHKLVLEGLFGKVRKVTTTKKLQDDDTLAPLNIFMLTLDYNETDKKENVGKTYQQEINWIVANERRNNFIRNLSIDMKGNTLVLFQFVDKHGKVLYDLISAKAKDSRKVFYVSGQTDATDRETIRKIVETQKDSIIVASLGTFSTGINIKNLHNIVFASPSKSQIRVLQSIGRSLRKSDDGRISKLYDLVDDLQHKSRKNYTLLHGEERLKIYQKEQFQYKEYRIKI
jgi:superfamily II DNA or RNA helicase